MVESASNAVPRIAQTVADRVEQVVNRATGRDDRNFLEKAADALTDNKGKVAIGAALLALIGAFVTQRAFNQAAGHTQTELAAEA